MKNKTTTILLIFILIQAGFCYGQISKSDTVSFYDLKFNGNNFYTKFKKIDKYVDDTKTHVTVLLGKYTDIPFEKFKDSAIIYTIYSDFFDFSYDIDAPEIIFMRNIRIVDKTEILIKKFKLTKNLKIQDLKKKFPNISENHYEDWDEDQLKLLIVKDNKKAYLYFNFKKNRLSDIMLRND